MTPPSAPRPAEPSQRRFWITFGTVGLGAALLLRWRGLPLVLVPETAAAIALVACALLEGVLRRRPGA